VLQSVARPPLRAVAAADMYALLRDKWRLGDAMAMAMLSVYGGHVVYNGSEAVAQ
jgi:hypothetical protein